MTSLQELLDTTTTTTGYGEGAISSVEKETKRYCLELKEYNNVLRVCHALSSLKCSGSNDNDSSTTTTTTPTTTNTTTTTDYIDSSSVNLSAQDLIKEFKHLKAYSILGFSNILFLF